MSRRACTPWAKSRPVIDGRPGKLKGNVSKRSRGASSDWRRNGRKVFYVNQRGLSPQRRCSCEKPKSREPGRNPGRRDRSQSVRSSDRRNEPSLNGGSALLEAG